MRRVLVLSTALSLLALATLRAQTLEAVRAFAFDLGLVDSSEPFAPTGNPALLYQRTDFRFYAEWQRANANSYLLSLSYPLSARLGLGLAWFTLRRQDLRILPEAAFNASFTQQKFLLALGAGGRIPWGHQLEVTYEANRALLLTGNPNAAPPFDDDQRIRLSYRLGFSQPLTPNLTLGFITPALVTYQYRTFLTGNRPTEAKMQFGEPLADRIWTPRFGLKWQPFAPLAFAFSNRPLESGARVQGAAELRALKKMRATFALTEGPRRDVILGLGGYIKGLEAFATYEAQRRDFRVAVSFAPESAKELLEVREIALAAPVFYPYRLQHNEPAWLAKIELRNQTAKPVEVSLKLAGHELPTIKRGITLEPSAQAFFEIPIPAAALQKLWAGIYLYDLDIVAFQRGRQQLQRQFSFEIKDAHDWSGESRDLLYFIQPHDKEILQTARTLLAACGSEARPLAIAACFYESLRRTLRYLPDPRPLRARQDRVQYANETMRLQSGDCEDLTILMVSWLESVGVRAAFVDLAPPNNEQGHIMLLFDSSQSPSEILEADNLQRYVLRQNGEQPGRLFIPLELTRFELSFEEAWREALRLYQKLGIDEHGLAEGWVKIIDADR